MTDTDININSLQKELSQTKLLQEQALQLKNFQAGFLGRISHEIRSPLTSIMGLQQLIINDLCDSPEEEREYIKHSYEYSKKLMAMIDQLVEVSKLEVGRIDLQPKEFNLWDLLEDIEEIMLLEAQNRNLKMQLINNSGDETPLISTDKTRLTNVLFYLLEVIIDRSEIGTITISLEKDETKLDCKIIKFTFPADQFDLTNNDLVGETGDNSATNQAEKSKLLNQNPQFSPQMKLEFCQTMFKLLQGKLELGECSADQENNLKELLVGLPVHLDV